MTLGDLASFIGGKIGMSDSATLTKLKAFARERYAAIYAGALWKDSLSVYTKAVAADQSSVILPAHVAHFVAAKYDTQRLVPVDTSFLFASDPELWDRAGTPTHCSELEPVATKAMPLAAGEQLSLISNALGPDTGKIITIHGEDANGDSLSERVTLLGMLTGTTVLTWAVVHGLSKPKTAGTITVAGVVSGTELLRLGPTETQRLHRRLRLHSIPTEALTLVVLGKRHPGPFAEDSDASTLPALCEQALQAMVHADALEWQRQYAKAQAKFAEGLALMEQAKRTEVYQAAQNQRFTPGDSLGDGCSPYDFL